MKVSKMLAMLAAGSIVALSCSAFADGARYGFIEDYMNEHMPGEQAGEYFNINKLLYTGKAEIDKKGNLIVSGSYFGALNLFADGNGSTVNTLKQCAANPDLGICRGDVSYTAIELLKKAASK